MGRLEDMEEKIDGLEKKYQNLDTAFKQLCQDGIVNAIGYSCEKQPLLKFDVFRLHPGLNPNVILLTPEKVVMLSNENENAFKQKEVVWGSKGQPQNGTWVQSFSGDQLTRATENAFFLINKDYFPKSIWEAFIVGYQGNSVSFKNISIDPSYKQLLLELKFSEQVTFDQITNINIFIVFANKALFKAN